jgi:hypothetical protein
MCPVRNVTYVSGRSIRFSLLIVGGGQVNHRFNTRNVSAFLADCQSRTLQVIWMVAAVCVLKDLRRHALEPSRFSDRHPVLHQPGCGGMS